MRRGVLAVLVIAVTSCGADKAADPTIVTTSARAPAVAPATTAAAPRAEPRVLLIGDSTLLAIDHYDAYRALKGFEYVYDAKSCRTLGIPSCGKRPLPPNAVEAINHSDGNFDDVVIMVPGVSQANQV